VETLVLELRKVNVSLWTLAEVSQETEALYIVGCEGKTEMGGLFLAPRYEVGS
jgi:hypothetical protein